MLITPSDTADLSAPAARIRVGVGGFLRVMEGDAARTVRVYVVQAGDVLVRPVVRVFRTGTTASALTTDMRGNWAADRPPAFEIPDSDATTTPEPTTTPAPTPDPLLANLFAYYRFDGDLYDSSGNGRHLTAQSSPPHTYAAGKTGQALSGGDVRNPADPGGDGNTLDTISFTVSGWFKGITGGNTRSRGQFGWSGLCDISPLGNGTMSVTLNQIVSTTIGSGTIVNGQWHHVVVVWDHTNGYGIYLDGNAVEGGLAGGNPAGVSLDQHFQVVQGETSYGSSPKDGVGFWKGRALSGEDVAALYASGADHDPTAATPPLESIVPVAAYYYDTSHYGLVFGVPVVLIGFPDFTAGGLGVFESALDGGGFDGPGVLVVTDGTGLLVSDSVTVPSDDPAIRVYTTGARVAAGVYPLEAPPALTNAEAPYISGDPYTGSSISSGTGNWSGYGFSWATYLYQWQGRVEDVGNPWFDIDGETSADFAITSEHLNWWLRCRVTAVLGGTSSSPAYTEATAGITDPPAPEVYDIVIDPTEGTTETYFTFSCSVGPGAETVQWQISSDGESWSDTGEPGTVSGGSYAEGVWYLSILVNGVHRTSPGSITVTAA